MPDRILITSAHRAFEGTEYFPANTVRVEIGDEVVERVTVPQTKSWDPDSLNQLGRPGGIRYRPDIVELNAIALAFVEKYGLTIQDNS